MGKGEGKKKKPMSAAVRLYLIAYNVVSAGGWALVWAEAFKAVRSKGGLNAVAATEFWKHGGTTLTYVQTLAALEIFHTLVGLVPSPLIMVFLQVNSRLIVLWLYTLASQSCQSHWSLLLMVGAWATTEVPRYLFYALNLVPATSGHNMPMPLFWLRYSLFLVMYPAGISGELLQMYTATTVDFSLATAWQRFLLVFPILVYPWASPLMIMNMWGNRKSQFKKRKLAKANGGKDPAPRKVEGLVWPVTDDATGDRKTSVTNQAIWEYAVANVDAEAASAVRRTRNWRFGYIKHIERQVQLALASEENALQIARDGLAKAHDAFEFVRDGKTTSLAKAMETYKGSYETGFIKGEGKRTVDECVVKYKGRTLRGDELRAQLDRWVAEGTIEPSAGDAIKEVMAHPEWVDLSDRYFVLLGATSAMGPLDLLLELGANIIGIDLDRPFIWEKLVGKVRASPGTLTFPLSKPQKDIANDEELFACAGANLLAATPEIANWLTDVCPGKQLTVGNYTYLDGALHVQLSVACDAIMQKVCAARKDTALAFLCTPTDVHMILDDAHAAAEANLANAPFYQKVLAKVMGRKDMVSNVRPAVPGSGLFYHDGVAEAQGPNYSLAKRMQHWRCVLARDAGHVVSSNVAPSTSTKSVTSNKLFAAAYAGFVLFKALEVMAPETSSTAMLALLLNDLRNPKSVSHPKVPLRNPMELFAHNAFHGGSFRCPYTIGSIGTVSVLYFVLANYGVALLPVLGGMAYTANYVATGSKPGLAAK